MTLSWGLYEPPDTRPDNSIVFRIRWNLSWWLYDTWWRRQMQIFSASLAFCAGNSPVVGEFPARRPVTRSFDVFFDLRLNKRLSKQSWGWWFETPSRPLWRHSNVCGTRRGWVSKGLMHVWHHAFIWIHNSDVIMGAIAYEVTSLTIVYATFYSDTDQRKHQSSASLAFVPAKMASNAEKCFPFDDVIMNVSLLTIWLIGINGKWKMNENIYKDRLKKYHGEIFSGPMCPGFNLSNAKYCRLGWCMCYEYSLYHNLVRQYHLSYLIPCHFRQSDLPKGAIIFLCVTKYFRITWFIITRDFHFSFHLVVLRFMWR